MQKILKELKAIDKTALFIFFLAFSIRIAYLGILLPHMPIDKIGSAERSDTIRYYMPLADDFYHLTVSDERLIYMTGFGYSLFLALLFLITAKSLLISLVLQIAVGALSTAYLYKIGYRITGNRSPSLIAASINAISPTALSLATSFLTETLFFACIVFAIYVFISIMESPTNKKWILLGGLVTYAIFTRSVAQFLPFVFIGVVLVIPPKFFSISKKVIVKGCLISMSAVIIIIASWALRNYFVNGLFTVAGTGPGAAAGYLGERVAAEQSDSLSLRDCSIIFNTELIEWMKADPGSTRRYNEWCVQKLRSLFLKDPLIFIHAYLLTVWDNVTAFDDLPLYRFPKYVGKIRHYTELAKKCLVDRIALALSLIGFVVLLLQRKVGIAILLSSIFVYFALISGFTSGQGSRIFYPAQAAGVFLISSAIYYPSLSAWRLLCRLWYSKLRGLASAAIASIMNVLSYPNRVFQAARADYNRFLILFFSSIFIIFIVPFVLIPALREPECRVVAGSHIFGDQIVLSQVRLEEKNGVTHDLLFDFYSLREIKDPYRVYFHLYPSGGDMINRDFGFEPPVPFWQPYIINTQRRHLNVKPGEYGVIMGVFLDLQNYLGDQYSFKITVK